MPVVPKLDLFEDSSNLLLSLHSKSAAYLCLICVNVLTLLTPELSFKVNNAMTLLMNAYIAGITENNLVGIYEIRVEASLASILNVI